MGLPASLGLAASLAMLAVYFVIVGLAQGWTQAVVLLGQDKFLIAPITAGFGAQVGLFSYLRAIIRVRMRGSAAMTGASGGMSTAVMVACCAHRVADLLPFLGLSGAAVFLAAYRVPFMVFGLAVSLAGISLMVRRIIKYRAQHIHEGGA